MKRTELDLMKCLEIVEKLTADKQGDVRQAASDSLDDLLHAIRRKGVS
ncbi:MAG TPA: hypothetical protein VJX72_12185 [Candidatus Acidoferrum sp.]|nr:hypothetical protein [Candidatus Acidoferrum sp.]